MRLMLLAFVLSLAATAAVAQPAAHHTGGRTEIVTDVLYGYDDDGRGRTLEQESEAHQWPGVYFETRFKGRKLNVYITDSHSRYKLYIDDKPPVILSGFSPVHFIRERKGGWHKARLEKISEAQNAVGYFYGFVAPSGKMETPPPRDRRIEFIGDSDMVGYASASTKRDCTPQEVHDTTDTSIGYPVLTAKHFDADYQINAYSGIGVVRNYDGNEPHRTLPKLYPRVVFDDAAPWDRSGWKPQVIVIAVGGNDYSTDLKPDEAWPDRAAFRSDWRKTFTAFVRDVRTHNPDAYILLGISGHFNAEYLADSEAAHAELSAQDDRVGKVIYPALDNTACNWHPSPGDHKTLSDLVIAHIVAKPDIWSSR